VEAVGLTTGPWTELPFACAGRCADPAPDNDPGVGRLVAGSMEPPESDESNSLALRLPTVARGALWGTEVPPPVEPGWRPLGWPVGRSPDPLALAAASSSPLRCPASAVARQPGTARLDGPLERPVPP
jgi:hypothetical protein